MSCASSYTWFGVDCPLSSKLVETGYINPRNFPEWPKKTAASDWGHTCWLLTRVVARKGDIQMLFGSPLPKFVVTSPPELKAAKMDTPDGGLLCQGCWDFLNRLDVCVHPGINRAASLKPVRRGWLVHWERNWDGDTWQQWAREGGDWAGRRLPGCISSCSVAVVLQSHLQRAERSEEPQQQLLAAVTPVVLKWGNSPAQPEHCMSSSRFMLQQPKP